MQKIEEMVCLNHHPSKTSFEPSDKKTYIVENGVKGLQKCLDDVKKDASSSSQKLMPIQVNIEKNKLYLASDILVKNQRVWEDEEKKKKEANEERRVITSFQGEASKRVRELEDKHLWLTFQNLNLWIKRL